MFCWCFIGRIGVLLVNVGVLMVNIGVGQRVLVFRR